jgi:hypothetical protein
MPRSLPRAGSLVGAEMPLHQARQRQASPRSCLSLVGAEIAQGLEMVPQIRESFHINPSRFDFILKPRGGNHHDSITQILSAMRRPSDPRDNLVLELPTRSTNCDRPLSWRQVRNGTKQNLLGSSPPQTLFMSVLAPSDIPMCPASLHYASTCFSTCTSAR